MNNSLKNFTVTLYSFHLRHTLTDAPDQVDKDANLLWENLIKLSEFLPFSELKELRTKLICYDEAGNYIPQNENGQQTESLATSGIIEFKPIKNDQFSLVGNVQPFRFNDTYAIDLTLFCEPFSTSIDTTDLTHFELNHLLPNSIQGSLGQTLWLYGKAEATDDECKEIAKLWANKLLTNEYKLVFRDQGKLFKSHIFQYELINLTEPQNPSKNCQILISINNHQADKIELEEKINDWIIEFLCCRHKILYIYQKAEQANQTARKQYVQIEKKIEEFSQAIAKPETRLETFKEMLNSIPIDSLNYSRSLRDLKTYSTSLSTNIINYKTCLKNILTPEDQVKFWQEFGDRTCKQLYQTQIEINLNYLSPGQDLLEQLINTIRSLVEIEQAEIDQENAKTLSKNEKEEAKRDKSLERTISTLGVGLGVGGIASSITSAYIEKPRTLSYLEKPVDPWILASLLSLLSIVIGAIAGFIIWQITKLISEEKNREETNREETNRENSPCNRD
ncbi:conserved hypothetical protein [Planktothrix serta PCC 8927]|uniref:Uncharacterized protein n=1 Tax=Planktothrix serta PCC 8927 TaxID=671068 RepID=A0A7Z9BNU2_9CYAN|nr:hypothetical protein [Planktothrix serta]VXD15805.1 conserved hypothetical protein [Planktothrix serta PCC 8927]